MILWQHRPREIAYLLNPAFCAEVMRRSIYSYQQVSNHVFPYTLLFLILPIILHRETRDRINAHRDFRLYTWLQSHQEVKIGFAKRVSALLPLSKEAIIFLLQVGAISLDENAGVTVIQYTPNKFSDEGQEEIADCFYKAEIIGRWFARAESSAGIYIMWGIKP